MDSHENQGTKPVGVSAMDAEHELMHDLLRWLQTALARERRADVADLLGRFEDAANLHFMEEQSLMRLHAYPGYAAHEQEHDELLAELRKLSDRIRSGELADSAEAAKSLEEWFMTHMNTTDATLVAYLEEQGIRTPSER